MKRAEPETSSTDAAAKAARADGPPQAQPRLRGECMEWSNKLGWGFIRPDDLTANIFCHHSALLDGVRSLAEGDAVVFEWLPPRPGESARRAANVRVAKAPTPGRSAKPGTLLVPRAVASRASKQTTARPAGNQTAARPASHPEAAVLGYGYS